jgi:hypothetical protein
MTQSSAMFADESGIPGILPWFSGHHMEQELDM